MVHSRGKILYFFAFIVWLGGCGGEAVENIKPEDNQRENFRKPATHQIQTGYQVKRITSIPLPQNNPSAVAISTNSMSDPDRLNSTPWTLKVPEYPQVLWLCRDGSLSIPADDALVNTLKSDFTLEFWFRLESNQDQTLFSSGGGSILVQSKHVSFKALHQTLIGLEVVEKQWYHVALIVEGNQIRLYTNGQLDDQINMITQTWHPDEKMQFGGAKEYNQESFCGLVENVRLTQGALYQNYYLLEQEFIPLEHMLVSYSFDGIQSDVVVDRSENGYNGQLSGEFILISGSI